MRSFAVPFTLLALLAVQVPSVAAANGAPAMETADPALGAYEMDGPGSFPVEVECGPDPEGGDVWVDFLANGRVVETDEDLWGFSPSFSFELPASGSYTLQARCRDTQGAASQPATWSVDVLAPPASPPPSSDDDSNEEASSEVAGFEWVTPAPGPHTMAGPGRFGVEVECMEGGRVDFLVDGKVVESDTDIWGLSPSYSFFLVKPGPHALAARCVPESGETAEVRWTATVPRPSAEGALADPEDCATLSDPASMPAADGEPGRVRTLLISNDDVWHRAGPWTCELSQLAEPLRLAYDIDATLVSVKTELEDWSLFDYSAWDAVAKAYPAVVPTWEVFEQLLPVLEACATAVSGLEAFQLVRTASVGFLTAPSDAQLDTLRAAALQALPAYEAWIGAFDLAADKVEELVRFLADLAAGLLAVAQELRADAGVVSGLVADGLDLLGGVAADWAALVQGWADGIRSLADPVRADVMVLHGILSPPEQGTPALDVPLLFLALALLAAGRRRH